MQNPYEQNPYASQSVPNVLLQPRPSTPKHGINTGVIIGVVALLLIISVAGVFATLGPGTNNAVTTTPTTNNAVTDTPTTGNAATNTPAPNNAASNPYSPFTGTLALDDPLRDNSRGYKWYEGNPYNNTSCQFIGGAYHVSIYQAGLTPCTAGNTNFSNFAFEVQAKMIKGGDSAEGIIFYVNNHKSYIFNLFQNGTYGLYLTVNNTDVPKLLKSGPSSAIKVGMNQTNLMAVVARNGTFDLYVNQQKLDSVSDTTYTKGQIGLDASTSGVPAEVVYSNARAWTL
ncbi:MAG: hypothetical protein JOZ18_17965 [Chloroflexi bacterium]|nr:hypothetical protein [Chloroflexota bacterium]